MSEASDRISELFAAIQTSDVERVKQLLASGVPLDRKNTNGQTALTLASSIGNSEIIEMLISAGAKINSEPEPLVINPQISGTKLPGGQNLADLIAQATADAPEEAKNFYAGFMSVVDALSNNSEQFSSTEIDDETTDELEDLAEDEDEESASTPLGAAILQGNIDTVRTLLQAGANPNPSVWHETPVLVVAARKGNVEIVQELIAAGANVKRGFDELPLHTAAEEGHLEVVRLLLDAGADVEGYEEDRWTALMAASLEGHLPVVKLLVERGADVNAWSQGETPLMLAAKGVHRDIYDFLYPLVCDEIRALGDRDAEKEMARTIRRQTREQNTAVEKLLDAAMYGNLKQVQQLIASGVDVNAIASCDRTALSLAIQGGHISVIQALLDAGANPNLPDETDDGLPDTSPLMQAGITFFATNRPEMVRLLIQRGANVNQQDIQGQTALMHALGYSDLGVITALIEAGADLNIRDRDGNTALMKAEFAGKSKAANILKQAGASQEGLKEVELIQAVNHGDIEKVKSLLQEKINVNLRVGETTALCRAAFKGHHEIAKLLIAAGADVNQRSSDGHFNPLLDAAYAGNLEVVRVLLEAGADVRVRVTDYLNPLEYAELGKQEGHKKGQPFDEVIALLESYGATRSQQT
ncbi:hypothetical protein BV372_14115 [Nostoc sp. T09]|uniref:ankyrin repeat domain-containing protein n=1 Tax=Nostoc sp. T09 TaxID=1932621 RepID=UPI000A378E39|nr:ankyrin repeat domain-containing protein [Nostoc sp. T09]OUL34366.1 hypothetical protein BV372_14115 [Nostoc sp. T09]